MVISMMPKKISVLPVAAGKNENKGQNFKKITS